MRNKKNLFGNSEGPDGFDGIAQTAWSLPFVADAPASYALDLSVPHPSANEQLVPLASLASIEIQDMSTAVRPSNWSASGSVQPQYLRPQVTADDLPDDPLFQVQWNLLNAGQSGGTPGVDVNITTAWVNGYTGKGVAVGVYDTAMDIRHTDLAANVDMSRKVVAGGTYVDPTRPANYGAEHATAVAGIIGALRNDDQVVGIAYEAKLTPVDIFGGDDSSYAWASLKFQDRFAVTNHSWGFTGAFVANPLETAEFNAYLSGFTSAAVKGRGGLGTIEVVAAGNYRQYGLSTETNGLTVDRHIIVVGATDDQGHVSYYSNPGASLLVVAPSSGDTNGVVTDDITGMPGYSSGNYTNTFGGTSAATPQVSGIAAVMLQANPKLGWRDVQDILSIAARHTGSDVGAHPQGYEASAWSFNGAGNWNGGGMHFSNDYGFGLVDASAAVSLAETWSVAFGAPHTASNEIAVVRTQTGSWDVGGGNVTNILFSLDKHVSLESVVLDLNDLQFSAANSLKIELISASGTVSTLLDGEGFNGSQITDGWELMSRQFSGEDAYGIWTIRITDVGPEDVGSLTSVTFKAYGSAVTDNSVHFYTDEFGDFWDEARGTLSDSSRPVTIDAAAVSSAVVVDLRTGLGTIDGATLTIAAGTDVQTVIGGMGDDQLQADDLGAGLYGGMGDDSLLGGLGLDRLDGGSGDDTIEGGAGNDVLVGGAGTDTVSYEHAAAGVTVSLASSSAQKTGGAGIDTLSGFEAVAGSAYNDVLTGSAQDNVLDGGDGDDILNGGGGNDTLIGGAGNDTVLFSALKTAVTVDLGTGAGGGSILTGIENVTGTALNDSLTGDAADNVLNGGGGNDMLSGGEGDDTLIGGAGADSLDGGGGVDTVSYAGSAAVTVNLLLGLGQGGDAKGDSFTGIENVIGSAKNDILTGDAADNTLSGGAGADLLAGGAGSDVLDGGDGADTASYAFSGVGVTVDLGSGTAAGGDAQGDTLVSVESVTGSAYDDMLTGDAGANRLDGGSGDDTIEGGAGNDVLVGGTGTDTVSYEHAAAGVTVSLATSSAQKTGGAGIDTLSGFEAIAGSAYNDVLTGSAQDNVLDGGDGDDILNGGGGNDTLIGGAGNDTVLFSALKTAVTVDLGTGAGGGSILTGIENVTGTALNDSLTGDAADNVLNGGGGNDMLSGGEGDDTLIGGAGADSLDGGGGVDTVSYAGSAAVTVNLLLGLGQGGDAKGDSFTGIENVIGSAKNDILTGDAADNTLSGGAGADLLAGGAGSDVLDGGDGADTASYAFSGVGVTVDLGSGTAAGGDAQGDTLVSVESVTGSAYDDMLTGDAGANRLDGGSGDDTIEGGAGNDVLVGGAGTDTVSYEHAAAGVTVSLASSSAQKTGGAGIDTLSGFEAVAGSAYNDVLTGSAQDNVLDGGDGDDILNGGGGNDTLIGGAGNDTVLFSALKTAVTVDLGTGAGGGSILTGIENVTGTALNDSLTGDAADNVLNGGGGNDMLSGGEGDDTLIGGAGADSLDGGGGVDTVSYAGSAAVTVNLLLGLGQGGDAKGDSFTGIENVIGSAKNDILTGDAADNTLSGGAGADLLAGGAGSDVLDGGDGADTASYAFSGVGVTVDLGSGTAAGGDAQGDTLVSVESVTGSAYDDMLTGDAGANRLDGGSGDDTIEGGAGNDVLVGGTGTDTVSYEHAAAGVTVSLATSSAQKTGGAGIDTLSGFEAIAGSAYNDVLTGSAQDNVLDGGDGDDILNGGGSSDTLIGGAGNDGFRFDKAAPGLATILDFNNTTESDCIVIRKAGFGINAKVGDSGDAWDFASHYFVSGEDAAATESGHGQFLFDTGSGALSWDADGVGAKAATILAVLDGDVALHAGDFLLV